jgi:hypothetical protein
VIGKAPRTGKSRGALVTMRRSEVVSICAPVGIRTPNLLIRRLGGVVRPRSGLNFFSLNQRHHVSNPPAAVPVRCCQDCSHFRPNGLSWLAAFASSLRPSVRRRVRKLDLVKRPDMPMSGRSIRGTSR